MKAIIASLCLSVATSAFGAASVKGNPDDWVLGTWHKTQDEDNQPVDIIEFRANGTLVSWGTSTGCMQIPTTYHFHGGYIYATGMVEKGVIAAVLRPSDDRTRLIFTSPRTRNNAVYERLAANPCSTVER